MKRSFLVVVLVLGAAGVAAVLLLLSSGSARRTVESAFRSGPSGPAVAGSRSPAAGEAPGAELANSELRLGDTWKTLDHGDLQSLVTNLRAAGFPPEIIRAVAAALVHEQFAAKRAQILGEQKVPPYWQAGSSLTMFSSPQMAALRQLAREEQETLKQLLGPDSATSEFTRYYQQRMFGDLAPEKADALQRVLSDYSDLRMQVLADAGNGSVLLPSDREKLGLLEKEQRDDIAALLTPDELQQYDLRSSPTAQRLRLQLAYFNPTQQEFDAIYALQSQFDQTYSGPAALGAIPTPDQMRQRQAAQEELQTQIKAALGDQRYVQYEESTNPGFQAASRIVSNLQLPAENAAAVWSLQQSIQQQIKAVNSTRGVSPAQRFESLSALDAQANQQLTTLLTPPGLAAYKQTSGGSWLRALEQNPRVRPPAASATGGH